MARGDFPRRRCKVILVGCWIVIFNTNRSYHEDFKSAASRLSAQLLVLSRWLPRPNRSAAPMNGTSIKAAVPTVTTDVRYRVRRGYPTYNLYRGYPAYSSYWGYPNNSYWSYPTYNDSYPGYTYGGWW